jgi:hypothetical protein
MLATLAELKAALGISGTDQDALLTSSLAQANGLIAGYIGADLSDTADRTETLYVPNGATFVNLPVWPVISLTSVTANGEAFTDHSLVKRSGGLFFDYLPGNPTRLGNEVEVVYSAGFATVPEDLKTVCLNIASTIYNRGGAVSTATGENELKSLTMFDAMSMSFDSSKSASDTPEGLIGTWAFILDQYRLKTPVLK